MALGTYRKEMFWAVLLQLGHNMWADHDRDVVRKRMQDYSPHLRCDYQLWSDILDKMVEVGMDMIVIDLGDGVKYESHPEIAVRDAWTVSQLQLELSKIRDRGLEPIPKMNFSAGHDTWLGPYSRCVSTETYYSVRHDLITEVIELFDNPRFFHLGMDEETAHNQRNYDYVVVRQGDLWWHDLLLLTEQVEKNGVQPWIFSDYIWEHRDPFFEKMPKSVLQSNWYYGSSFGVKDKQYGQKGIDDVQAYLDLEKHGYNQVPTGSNHSCPENFENLVAYCKKHISSERLYGFIQTAWRPTLEAYREQHMRAIELAGQARANWT